MKKKFVNLMQAKSLPYEHTHTKMTEYWESDGWVMEPTEDGKRIQCEIVDGNISFHLRKVENYLIEDYQQKIPYIIDSLKNFKCKNALLDGFLYSTDMSATIKILSSRVEKSLYLQENEFGKLRFAVHDIIYQDGESVYNWPFFKRRKLLEEIAVLDENITMPPIYEKDKLEKFLEIKDSWDGVFFKVYDAPYFFGRTEFCKFFKFKDSFFVTIMAIEEGKGKLEKMCGSLLVGQFIGNELKEITNVSNGINYDLRMEMYDNPTKFLNQVLEIKAVRTESSYRDARFKKIHWDMKPKDCKWMDHKEAVEVVRNEI